jgi:GNAT superfamily N-acetyltransferase
MKGARVERVGPDRARVVFLLVQDLLNELGEEGAETGALETTRLFEAWAQNADRNHVFLAFVGKGEPVGLLTLVEAFAFYANGNYGIINEMYVSAGYRSQGVGRLLLEAAKALGRERGFKRIDVAAPEAERWARTRRFYEREGFVFTGPKLKFIL